MRDNDDILKIDGIYKFVEENKDFFKLSLFLRIPYGSVVNYKSNYMFDITYEDDKKYLRIQTQRIGDNSSQGHVYISSKDVINYINDSKPVMDAILDIYKIESRNRKLENILS